MTTRPHVPGLVIVATSVIASAGVALWLAGGAAPATHTAQGVDPTRVAELEGTVARLVQELADLRLRPSRTIGEETFGEEQDPTSGADAPRADTGRTTLLPARAASSATFDARLRRLEASVRQLEQRLFPVRREPTPKQIAGWQRTILSATATIKDKLEAHQRLRRRSKAYTLPMVQELARIGLTHEDPQTRAEIWRQFDGSKVPAVVPSLLSALATDAIGNVRDEAAESLEPYVTDPNVRQALLHAATSDSDERVRRRAKRAVERFDAKRNRGR